ncbi:hypothetical protein K438DRAFT_1758784 [Mycena galopus ATCC 62051]|nr:hypothetical protein K438DRAFT_1758784 [Mycena galopus ATCC 62051]
MSFWRFGARPIFIKVVAHEKLSYARHQGIRGMWMRLEVVLNVELVVLNVNYHRSPQSQIAFTPGKATRWIDLDSAATHALLKPELWAPLRARPGAYYDPRTSWPVAISPHIYIVTDDHGDDIRDDGPACRRFATISQESGTELVVIDADELGVWGGGEHVPVAEFEFRCLARAAARIAVDAPTAWAVLAGGQEGAACELHTGMGVYAKNPKHEFRRLWCGFYEGMWAATEDGAGTGDIEHHQILNLRRRDSRRTLVATTVYAVVIFTTPGLWFLAITV